MIYIAKIEGLENQKIEAKATRFRLMHQQVMQTIGCFEVTQDHILRMDQRL